MFRKLVIPGSIVLASMAMLGSPATAAPPVQLSGAIFTTDASGNPVNLNIYDSKEDVYLNGGPGINAPDDAAGLPVGTYSFQVTDPSGQTLLSTDDVTCRQFTVDDSGVITSVTPSGNCAHQTGAGGNASEDGGISVQLFPYNDTPNNGGVYKVWVSPTNLLDCDAPGNKNCFVPRYSKVDNFKVRNNLIVEIDVRFWKNGTAMDGYAATWTDTNGASNIKYSEWNPAVLAFHEAHFEAVEPGTHGIRVESQPGCTITSVLLPTGKVVKASRGWASVSVTVADHTEGDHTYWVDVTCA
ncbi:hypothetical protein [Arthrobacter nitrophenolicus]|uniref:Uncharacterized protein n=1 Tax=Arthrobacter nitrophenolicus TaxID=683150 RepID=A0A4R5Y642_9MICC|nr:hypothetical protein [Arthrobacter nitrophenolicus]TDL40003.1 hypothetical protein E2R57_05980 [Arthrobacter nitrophenolicus]